MTTVVLTDLDQTLIYSRAAMHALAPGSDVPLLTCVEEMSGEPASFMTERAAARLAELSSRVPVLPVTTRTVEQVARVRLPGPPPPAVVCANGGRLVVQGVLDAAYSDRVARALADGGDPLAEVSRLLAPLVDRVASSHPVRFREVEDLFCYGVTDAGLPKGWVDEAVGTLGVRGWRVVEQGRKVYFLPDSLTKLRGAAAAVELLGAERVLAAGDSCLDVELMEMADHAIGPRHGVVAAHSFTSERVELTSARGVLAGEEIVDRLTEWAEA